MRLPSQIMKRIVPPKQLNLLFAFLLFLFSCLGVPPPVGSATQQESATPWKFAVVSDTQDNNQEKSNKTCINNHVVQAIAADMAREKPDFVLVAGDLVNGWFRNGGAGYDVQYAN